MFHLEFRAEVNHVIMASEDLMIVQRYIWHDTGLWQTDGQTDEQNLSQRYACYADAL